MRGKNLWEISLDFLKFRYNIPASIMEIVSRIGKNFAKLTQLKAWVKSNENNIKNKLNETINGINNKILRTDSSQ